MHGTVHTAKVGDQRSGTGSWNVRQNAVEVQAAAGWHMHQGTPLVLQPHSDGAFAVQSRRLTRHVLQQTAAQAVLRCRQGPKGWSHHVKLD